MARLAPGINVSGLHALLHRQSRREHAPDDAGQLRAGHRAAHPGHGRPLRHRLADPGQRLENPPRRGADDALPRIAADLPGHAGIGDGAALGEQPPQIVAPHGLHHAMAVRPGRKTRPQGQHHGSVGNAGAGVALGQDGVHQRVKGQRVQNFRRRIGQHRDLPRRQNASGLLRPGRTAGGDSLHGAGPVINALAERHAPPHGGRLLQIGHDH